MALGRHRTGESEEVAYKAITAGIVGGGFGFISASSKTGLDIGIGKFKAPIDLGLGVLGMAGSLFLPLDKNSRDMICNASAVAFGVGTFRKTEAFVKAKNAGVHGEAPHASQQLGMPPVNPWDAQVGEDPIVAAARML